MRPKIIAQDQPGGLDGFVGIEWIFARRRFAPARDAVHVGFDEQNAAQLGRAEARLKRREQPQMNFAEREFSELAFVRFRCQSSAISGRRQPGDCTARFENVVRRPAARFDCRSPRSPWQTLLELLARLGLNPRRSGAVACPDLSEIGGQRDALGRSFGDGSGSSARIDFTRSESSHHSATSRSVGRPAMQGAVRNAVAIGNVSARDSAQPHQIKMRVLEFQRIECPFDRERCRA